MFRSVTNNLALRISELIDDILVGDFDYILDGDELYADVDYFRKHPHHGPEQRPGGQPASSATRLPNLRFGQR